MPTYISTGTTYGNLPIASSQGGWQLVGQTRSPALGTGQYSDYLIVTGFGFSIPSGEAVIGISVDFTIGTTIISPGDTMFDHSVKLYSPVAVIGTDHASLTPYASGSGVRTYGGALDTWGLALTGADIVAGFGFALSTEANGLGDVARAFPLVTSMTITTVVESTGIPPVITPPGSGGSGGGAIFINTAFRRIPPDTVNFL